MSTMTLEQVRDWLRNEDKSYKERGYLPGHYDPFGAMADAIDAQLAKPAQAVDVGSIRGVIEEMRDSWRGPDPVIESWIDTLTSATNVKA